MSIDKSKTVKGNGHNSKRRSFIWRAGAAMSAGLVAAVPGMAQTSNNDKDLQSRLDRLEDENAIRKLHRTYEYYLESGRYSEIADLFTNNAEVQFNGGIYTEKNKGINRLYNDLFSAGMMGNTMASAPGFQIDADQQQDTIELAESGKSARARFSYSIQAGAPMEDDSVLVQMARLHGEGIRKWWEGGIYEITYVKDTKDGSWKITRLEHRVLARADFKPGGSQARPISVVPFNKVYPEEPMGPDRLITSA